MRRIIFVAVFTVLLLPLQGQIKINEYSSSNYLTLLDENNEFTDWFELYNNSGSIIDLTNYSVTDDISVPNKWVFPSVSLAANNFLIVFASGKDRRDPGGKLHTNFKLDSEGEGLYLFNTSGTLVDSIKPVALPHDVSYGRKPEGTANWYYFDDPTPGTNNSTAGAANIVTDSVIFSDKGGKHLGGIVVSLSAKNVSDKIYYSTDGSEPDKNDNLYTSPININIDTVIRARIIRDNALPGPVTTNTYVTSLDHEFAIVCLSTNPENLWDDSLGIYVYGTSYENYDPYLGANFWEEWEKPTQFELYDSLGVQQIDQLSGIKISGGWSRSNSQKSLAIFARKDYNKGSFSYQIFKNKPIDKYKSIVLRNGGNDYWGLRFQDEFLTSLTNNMDIDKQAFRPAATYLNGKYWGILNIREKVNEDYIAENYNIDPSQVNLLELYGNAIYGTNDKYFALMDFLNYSPTLSDLTDYNSVANQVDLNNYIQYQLSEIYFNNSDWPGNNIKYWNTNSTDSKWRWILIDTDFGFGLMGTYTDNSLAAALEPNGPYWPNPEWSTRLFRKLITNISFRNNFINQYADRINTDFAPSVVVAKIDEFKNLYSSEFIRHIDRWGGDYNNWLNTINDRKNYAIYRPFYARNHIQEQFSLEGQLDISINVSSAAEGKVKLNSITPTNYPFSGIYFKGVPIRMTAVPKPGYKFVRWEGSINSTDVTIDYDMASAGTFKAIFENATPADASIVINEINYNSSSAYPSKDWIELLNNGQTTIDLSGWLLSDTGIDTGYVFASGTTMTPGEYLVICSDLGAFRTVHPNINNSIGNFPFGLGSSGDQIFLYDNYKNLIDYTSYDVVSPWDNQANGTGRTLELLNSSSDNTLAGNWKAGNNGGTPGSLNLWDYTAIPSNSLTIHDNQLNCFPNPFSDYTTISFELKEESNIRLEVYDMNGALVEQLVAQHLTPNTYFIDWNGADQEGNNLPSGIYNIRLTNNSQIVNTKVVKLR